MQVNTHATSAAEATVLASAVGIRPSHFHLKLVEQITSTGQQRWSEIAEVFGIRARLWTAELSSVLDLVRRGAQVATACSDGSLLLISNVSREQLYCYTTVSSFKLSADEVKKRLPQQEQLEWLVLEHAAPLSAMVSNTSDDANRAMERLRRLIALERSDFWVVIIYGIGLGLLGLAVPIAVQALVNTVAFGVVLQPLFVLSVLLFAFLAFQAVLRGLQVWVVEVLQRRFFVKATTDITHRLLRVQRSKIPRRGFEELVNRFFDVFAVQKASAALLLGTTEAFLVAAIGLCLLAFYHPWLLAFDALLILSIVAIIAFSTRRGIETAIVESKDKYRVAAWLQQIARSNSSFRNKEARRFAEVQSDQLAIDYLGSRHRHFRIYFRQQIAAYAIQAVAGALLLGLGGWLVIARQLTLGQLVAAELIVTGVLASVAKLGKQLETFYNLSASLDKVGMLLDLPLESTQLGEERKPGAPPSLSLRHYPVQDKLIDAVIDPYEHTLFVGKYERISQLFRELWNGEWKQGQVLVDGLSLQPAELGWWRESIGLIHEANIFDGTLLENLSYGSTDVSKDQVNNLLNRFGWDNGSVSLTTRIGGNYGETLSNDSKVALMLVRAVLSRPSVLLIDGALDLLSPSRRAAVIQELMRDCECTVLLNSQQLDVAQYFKKQIQV